MLHRLIKVMEEGNADGAVPAVAVTDSLRLLLPDEELSQSVDRSHYRAVQTPQVFKSELLFEAYRTEKSPESFTDDASVMEDAGFVNLRLVEGSTDNIKITNPRDLAVAEALLPFIEKAN